MTSPKDFLLIVTEPYIVKSQPALQMLAGDSHEVR